MPEIPTNAPDDEIAAENRRQVEALHRGVTPPSAEDIAEVNNPEIIDETERKNFVSKATEWAINLVKKPTRRAKIVLGLLAFMCGAYYNRKEIFEWGVQAVMKNPHVISYVEHDFAAGHEMPEGQTVPPAELSAEKSEDPENITIEMNDNKFTLFADPEEFLKGNNDSGPRIEIKDKYLENILEPNSNNVKEAENEQAFREFIFEQINELYSGKEAKNRASFEKGDVSAFLYAVSNIVYKNLDYDKKTAEWNTIGADGRLAVKWVDFNRWRKANPISAFFSTNGSPVDRLLMEEHIGTCRQYSDASVLVGKEIKEMFPDKFQNIYITSFFNGFRWHVYNLVFVVKEAQKIDVIASEPQSGQTEAPAYELIKTMRTRNMIDQNEYFGILKQMLQVPKSHETGEDLLAIMESAKNENRPDVIRAVVEDKLSSIEDLLDWVYKYEVLDEADIPRLLPVILAKNNTISNGYIQRIFNLGELTGNEMVINASYNIVNDYVVHEWRNIPMFNCVEIVEKLREVNIMTDRQYLEWGLGFFESDNSSPLYTDDGKFLEFLLSHKEYQHHARAFLVREIQNYVKQPVWVREGYVDGEERSWTKEEALKTPEKNWDEISHNTTINHYKQKTGEDLIEKNKAQFMANMAALRHFVETHPKK